MSQNGLTHLKNPAAFTAARPPSAPDHPGTLCTKGKVSKPHRMTAQYQVPLSKLTFPQY